LVARTLGLPAWCGAAGDPRAAGTRKLAGWLLALLWLRFGAGVQGVADGVAHAPLGAAGRPAQRQEPACWALAFEMGEPFAVELVGELVQWLHVLPLGCLVQWCGRGPGCAGLAVRADRGKVIWLVVVGWV
jgi:hypothetical protein